VDSTITIVLNQAKKINPFSLIYSNIFSQMNHHPVFFNTAPISDKGILNLFTFYARIVQMILVLRRINIKLGIGAQRPIFVTPYKSIKPR